jgi:hypothetical protein
LPPAGAARRSRTSRNRLNNSVQFLIAGAGYTGQQVVARLGGEAVTALRSADIDLDQQGGALIDVPPDCRVLYTVPPNAARDGDPRLEHFLDLLSSPPTRIVYLSTTGVYGDRGGARVTEDTTPAPGNPRSARRLAAESALTAWCESRSTALTVLRVPGIYGPGRLGLDRLRSGTPVISSAEANPGNRIHVDDLARSCVQALSGASPPGIYNVGDGDHRSSSAFSTLVAELAGLPAPPEIPRDEAERSMSEMQLSFARESRVVDTTKMREVMGLTPTYADPADGIRASLKIPG